MASAWAYQAGTSGTVTVPAGCVVTCIRAQSSLAGGTVAIFGGTAIPLVGAAAPDTKSLDLVFSPIQDPSRPNDVIAPLSTVGATDIVFTSTVSYFVGYVRR